MSLINDALKRAQNQRGGPVSGHSAAPMTPGSAHTAPPSRGPKLPAWLMVGGGLVGGLALAAIVFIAARPAAPSAPAVEKPATETAPPPSEPATAAANVDVPTLKTTEPVATVSPRNASPEPSPAPPRDLPGDTAAVTPPTESPETAPRPAPGNVRPSTRMINAIEAFRVTGIRASGNDSKVLMNDRVYRLGDTVDHELGIKLTGATANSLTFVDDTGATYTRNFY